MPSGQPLRSSPFHGKRGDQLNIDKRTLFYWAKLYQGQLQKGQQYKDLARTITINVLGFSFLPDAAKYHSMFSLYEAKTGYRLNRDLELHFLELPKWKALNIAPRTRLDKWLTYLANTHPQEMEEIAMSEPAIKKALTAEEIFLKQDKERYLYEMREKALLDHVSAISDAEERGMAKAKRETAKRLFEMGLSIEDIAKATDLPIAEVRKLFRS